MSTDPPPKNEWVIVYETLSDPAARAMLAAIEGTLRPPTTKHLVDALVGQVNRLHTENRQLREAAQIALDTLDGLSPIGVVITAKGILQHALSAPQDGKESTHAEP